MRGGEYTVGNLISDLEQYDEDLPVLLMQQPSWPFEYSIDGLVSREEMDENSDPPRHKYEPRGEAPADEDEEIPCVNCGENQYATNHEISEEPNCVFVLEGTQLRYGSKEAWYGR